MINISEILVAFVCSTVLMAAMFIFNLQNNKLKHIDESVFQIMLLYHYLQIYLKLFLLF